MATTVRGTLNQPVRTEVIQRLNRIEGQIRGLKGMAEEDRYCPELLTQVASVHEALRGVARVILRHYLETCAAKAIRSAHPDGIYDELMDVFYKFAR